MTDVGWRARATGGDQDGRLPGAGWIIGTSCWLIPVLFFGGYGAWLGFLIIGALLLRTSWLVAAGLYAIWAIIGASLPDDQGRMIVIAALQVVSIIHGMIANRTLLLTVWGRLERGEQWWGRGAPQSSRRPTRRPTAAAPATRRRRPAADVPREAEELLSAVGTDRADYFDEPAAQLPPPRGSRRAGPPPPPTGSRARGSDPAPAEPAATVDVNTATVDEFRTLPGFTKKRAEAAVAARLGRSRFASVQEFADDLGLQPHELVRIRDRLTCSRPRRRSFGRRVDI